MERDELHRLLGVPDDLPWGRFAAEVLQPALDDIARSRRFIVAHKLERVRSRGRGGKVAAVIFEVFPWHVDVRHLPTPRAPNDAVFGSDGKLGLALLLRDRADLTLSVGAALRVTHWLRREMDTPDFPVPALVDLWQAAMMEALRSGDDDPSPVPGLRRAALLRHIATVGADQALLDFIRLEAASDWPLRRVMTPSTAAEAREAATGRWATEQGMEIKTPIADAARQAPIPAADWRVAFSDKVRPDAVPVPLNAAGPALAYVGPDGVSPPVMQARDPDDPLDDGLPPTAMVVIDIDWKRVSRLPRIAGAIDAALTAWDAAGRTAVATDALLTAADRAGDALTECQLGAMALLETRAVGNRPGGVRAVLRVANIGLIEHDGVVIRPAQPDRLMTWENIRLNEADAKTLLRDHPGCRVVFVTK